MRYYCKVTALLHHINAYHACRSTTDLSLFDKAENLMKRHNITFEELLTFNISSTLTPKITEKARKYEQTGWDKAPLTLLRIIKPLVTPQKTPMKRKDTHLRTGHTIITH